jgi:uncharacterized protein YkwD
VISPERTTRTPRSTAARLATAFAVAGSLFAVQSVGPVAFAASHPQSRAHTAMCVRHHGAPCKRVATRPARHLHTVVSTAPVVATAPVRATAPGVATSPGAPSAAPSPAATTPCTNGNLVPTSSNHVQIAAATLCLVNAQRALAGEGPLRENANLDSSAAHHSQDMVAANYFDHTSPTGETPLDRITASGYLPAGWAYELGENIAAGTLQLSTPSAIVTGWMNSPDHRANILNADFTDSGIGVVAQVPAQYSGGQAGATYTQDFGVVQAP